MATCLYHPTKPPQIVDSADAVQRLLKDGWAETPAAFAVIPEPDPEPVPEPVPVRRGRPRKEM